MAAMAMINVFSATAATPIVTLCARNQVMMILDLERWDFIVKFAV